MREANRYKLFRSFEEKEDLVPIPNIVPSVLSPFVDNELQIPEEPTERLFPGALKFWTVFQKRCFREDWVVVCHLRTSNRAQGDVAL